MDIQPISKNKFIVQLTCDDMTSLDITYDEMDYSNIETRRVIWTILDTVRQDTGRDVDPSANLVIEAAPNIGGGCVLMFTVPECVEIKNICTEKSRKSETSIYEFENIDNLLDYISAENMNGRDFRIFSNGEKYRIEFHTKRDSISKHILCEYSRFIGKGTLVSAKTHELWQELNTQSFNSLSAIVCAENRTACD